MEIKLNCYPRDFYGEKEGVPFEPQIWHRIPFLKKNFIRFFDEKYLVGELCVVVAPSKEVLSPFEFILKNEVVHVLPVFHNVALKCN